MKTLRILLLAIACSLCGCAGKYQSKLDFNPQEPIRVALLPFVQVDKKGQIITPDSSFLIDDVSVISSHLKDTPAEFVEKLVAKDLEKTGLDVIAPASVHGKFQHNGFAHNDLSLDVPKILATDPKEICAKLLECDAVLYGRVTDWDRSYFAIQSNASVAIDLKLVSASDGKVLFSSTASDNDSRGLTKGPTGFSDLVIEPLKGLDNNIITGLARSVVNKMLAPLAVENRPEFLNSSPPAIFASADDSDDGTLKHSQSLKVLLFGSANKTASFSIGEVIQHIPMSQRDEGHYIGEYFPLPSDSFQSQPVYVFLTDEFGRTTRQKIGNGTITLKTSAAS